MNNEDAIIAGQDGLARPDELAPDVGLAEEAEGEPETLEVELDGQIYAIPAALKGAFLRQADYTRKTQELAEHRRALAAERESAAELSKAARGEVSDRAQLAALDEQIAAFEGADWQMLAQSDPRRAQALWAGFQETREIRDRYVQAVGHHDQRGQLTSARDAAERMAQTGAKLRDEIEGWSPDVAAKLVDYAQAFGVTLEELREAADPRLWKILHRAYQADQTTQRDTAAQAQALRPAVLVAGAAAGGGGVRDELATKDWMARRNEQMAKGR